MSERISGTERAATQRINAIGAITSTGSLITAFASTPKETARATAIGMTTPATTPRIENRELSVMTGIASQDNVGTRAPPFSATAAAMITQLSTHAANMRYSGLVSRCINLSAMTKQIAPGPMNSNGHHPSQGPVATSATVGIANARCLT